MLDVFVATRAEEDPIVSVITLAFGDDPAARRLYSSPAQYLRYFPQFVRLYGGPAFDRGGAHYVHGCKGAALWFAPGVHADDAALGRLLEESVADTAMPELREVHEAMRQCHPTEPHWYLLLIGIDPAAQGQGYGTALMSYGLKACDRDGQLAYLDSTNPRNIRLYQRLGFELLETIEIGKHPPVYPMLRRPR